MFQKILTNRNLPYWFFSFALLILLTLPKLIQDGMFLDGMLYTCVSHNLSHGIGSFWLPQYSASYMNAGSPFFMEHPPLVFGIQSLFFRLLGDSMYVERIYVFLTLCITAYLLVLLWKIIFRNDENLRKIGWLPVLFWITIPSCSWSFSNNMMENTLGLFTLSAVIFIYRAVSSEKNKPAFLLLGGLFVFLATLSKGVPGFFPLSVPFLYWICFRKNSFLKPLIQTLLILIVPVLLYLLLFKMPQSHDSLQFYVTKRLLGRIGDNPTVGSRFYIIKRLFSELLPQISITLLIIGITRFRKNNPLLISNISLFSFFFLTGLAASIPMILTLVQRGFYLVPSFPYFAIAFSILIAPIALNLVEKVFKEKQTFIITLISSFTILVFAILFSMLQVGKTSRDRDMLHDVHAIGNTIPGKSAITVNQEIADTYVLECYFIRYYDISLFIDKPKEYMMVKKSDNTVVSNDFEKINIETKVYDLYQRKTENSERFSP